MKTKILFAAAFAALSIVGLSAASAHEFKLGDLVIEHPWAKSTLPNQPVAGGFMTITNNGKQADTLIGGSVGFAGEFQVHEMAMDNGVMKMRQLADGLEIPAGGTVELKPGGYHLMFLQLKEPLKAGETRKGTLTFSSAGSIEVEFQVEDMKDMMNNKAATTHGQMDGGTMNDGKMGEKPTN